MHLPHRAPKGRTSKFDAGRISIGRAPGNMLCLGEDARRVSSHHAEVVWRGDQYLLRDLGSTNGTMINGRRVVVGELAHDDLIEFGAISVNRMGPQGLVTERSESRRGTETSGQITVLEGERDLMRGNRELVLHLEDGRYRPFFVQEGDPLNGTSEVGLSDSF